MQFIVYSQAITTLFLCGLIWFVQVVHYPLFARVGLTAFAQYQVDHERRTAWVVVLPMLAELSGSVALLFVRPPSCSLGTAILGLGLVGIIWLSTALLQVPRHRVLEAGFNASAHRQLVVTNWIRTVAWTLRAVIVVYLVSTLTP